MLEAAERGALDRRRARIVGIDLDHPAEAVGLVRLLLDVEAVDVLGPGIPGGLRHAVALVGLGIGHLLGIAAEVAVEVLLGRQPGAPRRRAAGAVVQHAENLAAGRIGRGLELVVAGGGAGHLERRVGRDAPGVLAVDHLPGAAVAGDLDDRPAVRGQLDLDLRLGGLEVDVTARAQAREHQAGIGVLVVDDHEEAIARRAAGGQRMQADEVAVVAELLFLRGGRQVVGIEGRRAGDDGIAPADQHLRLVALGHVLGLVQAVRHLLEGERRGTGRLGERAAAQELVRERGGGAGPHQAAQGRPAAQAPLDQLAHRRLGAGVRARIFGVDVSGAAQVHPISPLADFAAGGRPSRAMAT